MKDIAAAANCSANTVSRALRDCADIGDETKEKIKRIAAELNYVPDNIAGSLRYGKTNLIALVASSLTDPFVAAASDMLVRRLRDKGFIPILMIARGDRRGALLADIKANRVCAVISFFDPDDDIKEYCKGGGGTPLLVMGNTSDSAVSSVGVDDRACGELVAKAFAESEKRRPCYVGCNCGESDRLRRDGFARALAETGATCDEYVAADEGLRDKLIQSDNDFIFCYNDEVAAAVAGELDRAGYPDATVFGVDGVFRYLPIYKKVNTVCGDIVAMTDSAADIIAEMVINGGAQPSRKVFPVEVVKVK